MAHLKDFKLTEDAAVENIPAVCNMTLDGFDDDPVWFELMCNVACEDTYKFLRSIFTQVALDILTLDTSRSKKRIPRDCQISATLYLCGYLLLNRRLVAWIALFCAQSEDLTTHSRKQTKNMTDTDIPGTDQCLASISFQSGSTIQYGYDPATHFR